MCGSHASRIPLDAIEPSPPNLHQTSGNDHTLSGKCGLKKTQLAIPNDINQWSPHILCTAVHTIVCRSAFFSESPYKSHKQPPSWGTHPHNQTHIVCSRHCFPIPRRGRKISLRCETPRQRAHASALFPAALFSERAVDSCRPIQTYSRLPFVAPGLLYTRPFCALQLVQVEWIPSARDL